MIFMYLHNRHRLSYKSNLIVAVLLLFMSVEARTATFLNGNFESGNLAGWNSSGDVAVVSIATLSPKALVGSYAAALTTASKINQDDYPNAIGGLNLSGVEPSGAGFTTELNTFLGISQTALDIDSTTQSVEGSALKQTISLLAGDKVNFKWQFLSADSIVGDYAFVSINGVVTKLADLAGASASTGLLLPLNFATGVNTFSYSASSSGAYSFALGVVDVVDYVGSSMLIVDDFQVTAIPEPHQVSMLLAGLGSVALIARRRRNL
jgi:hypothetical protein